jgi:hypothetical protein
MGCSPLLKFGTVAALLASTLRQDGHSQALDWNLLQPKHPGTTHLFAYFKSNGTPLLVEQVRYRELGNWFLLSGFPAQSRQRAGESDRAYYRSLQALGGIVTLSKHRTGLYPIDNVGIWGRLASGDTLAFHCESFLDATTREERTCEGTIDLTSGNVVFRANQLQLSRIEDELLGSPNPDCVARARESERARMECAFRSLPARYVCWLVAHLRAESTCRRTRADG